MKKQLIILVITILLVCVVLSGCLEGDTQGESDLNIDEINTHPNRYINTTITLQAEYRGKMTGIGDWEYIIDYYTYNSLRVSFLNTADTSILIKGGEYYFTGKILQTEETITGETTKFIYLEVSSIQPTPWL